MREAGESTGPIGPDNHLPRKRISVLDSDMSYIDVGDGDPVVFLHGNPTSSYLWRNIVPYVAPFRRCLAPDLIGMGQSGKPRSRYRFVDHVAYLDAWFDALDLGPRVTLVGHDWGGALGLYWALRHPASIAAIAYMETFVQPRRWDDLSPMAQDFFRRIRSPEGERMILDDNAFVEVGLPRATLRRLSEAEMDAYRSPYREREARLPTLVWPREQPIDGEPADVVDIVARYSNWLPHSDIPKLFVNAEPGSLIAGRARDFCRTWRNQREITVKGIHFIQEDAPHEIGRALRAFLAD